jgi:hypothetical protein
MEKLLIGLVVLGMMLVVMIVIAWLAIRESRREYDEAMRHLGEKGRDRPDPPILNHSAAQPEGSAPA